MSTTLSVLYGMAALYAILRSQLCFARLVSIEDLQVALAG